MENQKVLVDYLYFMALDIQVIDEQSINLTRRTRVINIYDNGVEQGYTWIGNTLQNRKALKNIIWDMIIQKRVLLLTNIHAYKPLSNPNYQKRVNAKPLNEFIQRFHLFINNKAGYSRRPINRGVSIINLALLMIELGLLSLWKIPKDFVLVFDHKQIILYWNNMRYNL